MSDLREQMQEGLKDLQPRWRSPGDVRERARRRKGRSRVGAGVLAVVVAVGVFSWALPALRDTPQPGKRSESLPAGVGTTLDLDSLTPSWSASLPAGSPYPPNVLADEDNLYVLTDIDEVAAFSKDCSSPCDPLWVGGFQASSVPYDVSLALGDGVVFVSADRDLYAFDARCSAGGDRCEPLWQASAPPGSRFTGPLTYGDMVRVMYAVEGGGGDIVVKAAAYPAHGCRIDHGLCQPRWTADLDSGGCCGIYSPGTQVDGVFYQQVGTRLFGVPADCAESGGRCAPTFSVEALGDPSTQAGSLYGPVAVGDELIVSSGDGNVYAYPKDCIDCSPWWYGRASDYIEGQPVLAGHLVLVVVKSEVVAFPVDCARDGKECAASWRAPLEDFGVIEYADDSQVVVIDRRSEDGLIYDFPTSCADPCAPSWTARPSASAQGIASDGTYIFVGVKGGSIEAYPLDCADPCQPSWRSSVEGQQVGVLVVDASGLYAAVATGSDPSRGLHLAAFRE